MNARNRAGSLLLVGLTLGMPAWLGLARPEPPATPSHAEPRSKTDLAEFTAREIARAALMDLRLRDVPETTDFLVASAGFGLAMELAPTDEEFLRWHMSLLEAADDTDGVERDLTRLLELAPRDTAAQYRLISLRLKRVQRIEDRLARYDAVLGPKGAALDPAIRSRLAFEAARLHREVGDETAFLAKLKVATSLDPTNKDAARAALAYFAMKSQDQIGRLELVGNLLNADPTDPTTHLQMAHELFAGGAFEAAKRFQDNAISVYGRAGIDRGTPGLMEELAIDWPMDGPAKVVERLNTVLEGRRAEVRRVISQLKQDLQSTQDIPPPEEIRLDPSLDRVRLLAAKAAGDSKTADEAATDLRKSYDEAFVRLKSADVQPSADFDPLKAARSLRLELGALLLWAGQAPETVAQDIEAVATDPDGDPADPALAEARGWLLARTEKAAEAVALLTPIADDRPVARLGLGAALEALERKDEAGEVYKRAIREDPVTIEACWAMERLKALSGQQSPDPSLTKKMNTFAAGIPTVMDDMTREPHQLMSLTAEVTESSVPATEPSVLRVTLSNLSTMPLGVGIERTVDSRILVNPAPEIPVRSLRDGVTPEVLDLERRLRLMPRESIEVRFHPDPGATGWLVGTACDQTVRISWRLLQGFERGPKGNIDAGPTSLTAGTRSQVRASLPEASLSTDELGARLADAPEDELPALVLAARNRLLAQTPGSEPAPSAPRRSDEPPAPSPPIEDHPLLSDGEREKIAAGAVRRFQTSSALVRRVLLAALPHGGQVGPMKALDNVARNDTDPSVLCLFLITRVTDASDELIARSKDSPDARLASTARLMEERLAAGSFCYGKLGPGLVGLTGPRAGEKK